MSNLLLKIQTIDLHLKQWGSGSGWPGWVSWDSTVTMPPCEDGAAAAAAAFATRNLAASKNLAAMTLPESTGITGRPEPKVFL